MLKLAHLYYKVRQCCQLLSLLIASSSMLEAATFEIQEGRSAQVPYVFGDVYYNNTKHTNTYSATDTDFRHSLTQSYINDPNSLASFISDELTPYLNDIKIVLFSSLISKALNASAAFKLYHVNNIDMSNSSLDSATNGFEFLNNRSLMLSFLSSKINAGKIAIASKNKVNVDLNINYSEIEATEAAIQLASGNIIIENSTINGKDGIALDIFDSNHSNIQLKGAETKINGRTGLKLTGKGRSEFSAEDNVHFESSDIGIDIHNLDNTDLFQTKLTFKESSLKSAKQAILGNTHTFVELELNNSKIENAVGDAIKLDSGSISMNNSSLSSQLNGIVAMQDLELDLRQADIIVSANEETDSVHTARPYGIGVLAYGETNIKQFQSNINATNYGIASIGKNLSIFGEYYSYISGRNAALSRSGSGTVNLLGSTNLYSDQNGILLNNAKHTTINFAIDSTNTITATDIFKIQSSENSILNFHSAAQFNILNAGNLFKTENNGDIQFTVNSKPETVLQFKDATGITIAGTEAGETSLLFNHFNLTTTGSNAAAIKINRASTIKNSLNFNESSLHSQEAPTIRFSNGHLLSTIIRSRISSFTQTNQLGDAIVIDQNANDSSGTFYFSCSKLIGNVINRSTTALINLYFNGDSLFQGGTDKVNQVNLNEIQTRWEMGFNSNLQSLINNGHFYFNTLFVNDNGSTQTTEAKRLTINQQYASHYGQLHFNVNLNPNQKSDQLILHGQSSGTSIVSLDKITGLGQKITEIELVNIDHQSDALFLLDRLYSASGLNYILDKGNSVNNNSWYLRSTTQPNIGAYLGNRLNSIHLFSHSLKDRLGETAFRKNTVDKQQPISLIIRNSRSHGFASEQDLHLKMATRFLLLAVNLKEWQTTKTDFWNFGVILGQGNGSTISNSQGYKELFVGSQAKVDGYSIGNYLTWSSHAIQSEGLYWDNWLQYSWFKNRLIESNAATQHYRSKNFQVSSELGYAWKLTEKSSQQWIIETHGQASFHDYRTQNASQNHNLTNNLNQTKSKGFASRFGVKFYAQNNSIKPTLDPFIELNWLYDHAMQRPINVGVNTFKLDIPEHRYEIKVGVHLQLSKNWQTWINTSLQSDYAHSNYKKLISSAGVKLLF